MPQIEVQTKKKNAPEDRGKGLLTRRLMNKPIVENESINSTFQKAQLKQVKSQYSKRNPYI